MIKDARLFIRRCVTLARSYTAWVGLFLMSALLAGCRGGVQSVIDPAGPQASRISKIWWLFFYVTTAVFLIVIVFLFLAIYKGRLRKETRLATPEVEEKPGHAPDPHREQRMTRAVMGAVVITVITLVVLTVASFWTGRALSSELPIENAVTIEVTGHQWWWEVRYGNSDPSKIFITANEIHIPVGQPVSISLKSTDVIHSFWVPNLMGKKDLIPGHGATLWIQANQPGQYRGQCAEYCGLQHAHMALWVVAEPPDKFQAWEDQQRSASVQPSTDSQTRGQQVFLNSPCIMCHTIQGTPAGSNFGPNLTHLASRATIAAGTLPNTRGHLSGWIVDSQGIKPGNHMPPNSLKPDDLQALLDYLQGLK